MEGYKESEVHFEKDIPYSRHSPPLLLPRRPFQSLKVRPQAFPTVLLASLQATIEPVISNLHQQSHSFKNYNEEQF